MEFQTKVLALYPSSPILQVQTDWRKKALLSIHNICFLNIITFYTEIKIKNISLNKDNKINKCCIFIEKNTLAIFRTEPSERTAGGITKCIIN